MTPFATFAEVIGASALLVSVLTFILLRLDKGRERLTAHTALWTTRMQTAQDGITRLVERFLPLEQDLAILKKQMDLFWRGLAVSGAQTLHSPHTPEFDHMLERFQQDVMTPEELDVFKSVLMALIQDPHEEVVRQKAAREVLLSLYVRFQIHDEVHDLGASGYDFTRIFTHFERDIVKLLPPKTTPPSDTTSSGSDKGSLA